ncbi:MAG TPA: glycosyltransferase family 39 protein [Gammaproteobacteria bacterium]|nr:glycosyltransferase family 39 protein [Gammaproteobacteria bacterium]
MPLPAITPRDKNRERKLLLILAVTVVVFFGAYLRLGAVRHTVVNHPYRSDAAEYYRTAYNLNHFGVFSRTIEVVDGKESPPTPDAYRTPVYPLFLTLFVHEPPNDQTFVTVAFWQALMGVATVLLVFLLTSRITGPMTGLLAAALVAMSPHLVNASLYMLTETLFTLLLVLSVLVFSLHTRGPRWYLPALFASGVLMGVTALTRPVLEFFPLAIFLLLALSYPRRQALKGAAVLLLGFALVWTPWIARNYISLGTSGDSGTLLETLAAGVYPDMEYNHDPRFRSEPDHQDPRYMEIKSSVGSVAEEFWRRVRENPGKEVGWYLVGKPVTLWSWDMTEGGGDAFIYSVIITPYATSLPFVISHALMQTLHWVLVMLALAGCILVWTPVARRLLVEPPLLLARMMSLLLLYNTLVMMIMTPWVRYSIPFLPIQFGMAAVCLTLTYRHFVSRRTRGEP